MHKTGNSLGIVYINMEILRHLGKNGDQLVCLKSEAFDYVSDCNISKFDISHSSNTLPNLQSISSASRPSKNNAKKFKRRLANNASITINI